MARLARQFLYGFLGGTLLSLLRAPAGLDLVHLATPSAFDAALFRAAALLALVPALDRARKAWRDGVAPLTLLSGLALGYGAHGLGPAGAWQLETRLEVLVVLLAATVLAFLLSGGRDPQRSDDPEDPSLRERLGLALVGAGCAVALEHLARYSRLFGVGLPQDDSLFGAVFLVLLAIGAVAFAPLLRKAEWESARLAGLGVVVAASTYVGLRFADHLEYTPGRDPLYNYLLRFGLDLTEIGTLEVTALLAAALFVVPGFACGALLGLARSANRLGALVTGGALGLVLLPWIVRATSRAYPDPELWEASWAWMPWILGLVLAGCGALLVVLTTKTGRRGAGFAYASVLLGIVCVVFLPRLAVWPFSPWYIVPIEPLLAVPDPLGMMTVEPERGGARIVTLDRQLVTPTARKEEVDQRRIEWSWMLLPDELRAAQPRVLFVGQMTPPRARVLRGLGAMRLERTVPWHGSVAALEEVLFEDEDAPPGARIEPREALKRIREGAYDLVLCTPIQGPLLRPKSAYVLPWGIPRAPSLQNLSVPEGTRAVVWVDAGADLSGRELPERAILAAKHFDDLSVGFLFGFDEARRSESTPAIFATGTPSDDGELGWNLLQRLADRRAMVRLADWTARLAAANEADSSASKLASGLEVHYAAQAVSSPWQDYSSQIEIEEDELRLLYEAAAEGPLDPFTRALWEDLALLLAEKRRIDMILVYLEPLMEQYGPWDTLERAVAYAYGEFNMPDEAIAVLEGILDRQPYQIDLLLEGAKFAAAKGDRDQRQGFIDRALAIQPEHFKGRLAQVELWLDAEDPRGEELLAELQALDPENDDLALMLAERRAESGNE